MKLRRGASTGKYYDVDEDHSKIEIGVNQQFIRYLFPKYNKSLADRTQNFTVDLTWDDVLQIIDQFARNYRNSDALRMLRLLRQAKEHT